MTVLELTIREEGIQKERIGLTRISRSEMGLSLEANIFNIFCGFGSWPKKSNYRARIDDEALSRFAPSKEFGDTSFSGRDDWSKWAQGKIDQGDFRNRMLKRQVEKEHNPTVMKEKLEFKRPPDVKTVVRRFIKQLILSVLPERPAVCWLNPLKAIPDRVLSLTGVLCIAERPARTDRSEHFINFYIRHRLSSCAQGRS